MYKNLFIFIISLKNKYVQSLCEFFSYEIAAVKAFLWIKKG